MKQPNATHTCQEKDLSIDSMSTKQEAFYMRIRASFSLIVHFAEISFNETRFFVMLTVNLSKSAVIDITVINFNFN